MKIMKNITSSVIAFFVSIGCINLGCNTNFDVNAISTYTYTYECDANNDGDTDLADVITIYQYIAGTYNIVDPDEADFDNDGIISELDCYRLQNYLLNNPVSINPDDTTGSTTNLLNTTKQYYRYSATTGSLLETYDVNAATTIGLTSIGNLSDRSVLGVDERYPDYSHCGICKITNTDGSGGTGFVVSDNGILTAGHVVIGKQIFSITFYNSNGGVVYTPTAVDYSIPSDYSLSSPTDYALITVSDICDLSDFNVFGHGYALDRAIIEEANVSVTGFSGDLNYESTGEGCLKNSTDGYNELKYTCDTKPGASGAPIYTDLVYNDEHYYIVVGIHTSGTGGIHSYNSGVRMCPNIWHLVNSNS